ncbi:SPX domain-domain-containing protein [Protomyces lactucae-debilis]|uniref:SPX domain-domain-containing protein n=1 Tax=Protomyces lactucae-debilis TaxID=2754530 RepID=A0A1Y2FKJ1_PROLT|nr:SPX domain-containing protein [Protomyces lactucae-debilis]ORY84449.1 SPX domain-domain-containing protein [Protomyces lactucae-debilis]
MKFGKSFEKQLEDEDIPAEWRAAAIKYKSLKKCITRVVQELESLGLRPETIKDLLDTSAAPDATRSSGGAIEYLFDGTTRSIQPKIRFTVDTTGAHMAELSSTTRTALRDLLQKAAANATSSKGEEMPSLDRVASHGSSSSSEALYDPVQGEKLEEEVERIRLHRQQLKLKRPPVLGTACSNGATGDEPCAEHRELQTIQIKLDSDLEFFDMLSQELDTLDALEEREKQSVAISINQLGSEVSALVRPNNKGKLNPDLEAWRKLLRLYEDAGVFQPVSESQRRSHTPEKAARQLAWFAKEVERTGILVTNAKRGNAKSQALYNTFNILNLAILRQIKFHSMNQEAMSKILKKFDKRTALTARRSFPDFMASDPFFGKGLAQAMYAAIASNILSIVPQLDDYACPVCTSITVKPIRLDCGHIFCVRCLITLQLSREKHCPICRKPNVLRADSSNIDYALLNFLKQYFPVEAKQKQKENEREQLRAEMLAAGMDPDKSSGCVVM